MVNIQLNFQCLSGTSVTGGHRSSNGWVTAWEDYTVYRLTTDRNDVKLSLQEMQIITDFKSCYEDSSEKDHDWGVYITEEHNVCNIDITSLIEKLNNAQGKHVYVYNETAQPYVIDDMLTFSQKELHEAKSSVVQTLREKSAALEELNKHFEELLLKRIYPILLEMIANDQVEFSVPFAGTSYFPADILAVNGDAELLIRSVLSNQVAYSECNAVYLSITTSTPNFYLELLEENASGFTSDETKRLREFLEEMEALFGNSISTPTTYQCPKLMKGMVGLVMSLLLNGDFPHYYELLEKKQIYKRQEGFCFSTLLKFAYLAYGRWENLDFEANGCSKRTDRDFFSERIFGSACLPKECVVFLQMIHESEPIIERLATIYPYKGANDGSAVDYIRKNLRRRISEHDSKKIMVQGAEFF